MLIAEKVSLPAITTKRGDLIGLCRITEQYYSMAVVVKLGYDVSLSTKEWPAEMENLRHYVKAFMTFHYEQVYARRIKDLEKQMNQDIPIWENKKYFDRPVLCEEDGQFGVYRKWMRQFFSEQW